MIAGHFGFAAGVKAAEPQIPLWSLMLATAWLDVVFVPLFAANIEWIEPVPGTAGGYGNSIIHADYTHSLLGALVLSGVYGAAFLPRWGRRAAWRFAAGDVRGPRRHPRAGGAAARGRGRRRP